VHRAVQRIDLRHRVRPRHRPIHQIPGHQAHRHAPRDDAGDDRRRREPRLRESRHAPRPDQSDRTPRRTRQDQDGWQPETEIGYINPEGAQASRKTLELDGPVRCIEGIDIAHLQGGETVGSKVCFVDGRPFKDEYRRYRIKSFENLPRQPRNDDYMSIREVVSRRYRDAGAGEELYPDVILIDGGLGQLHAALEAFDTSTPPPMVISLAKKEELIYVQRAASPSA
jgi:excinuclease ABC subunit C